MMAELLPVTIIYLIYFFLYPAPPHSSLELLLNFAKRQIRYVLIFFVSHFCFCLFCSAALLVRIIIYVYFPLYKNPNEYTTLL